MQPVPEHIDELIALCLAGEATEAQVAELRHWREADPLHEKYFTQCEAVFSVQPETDTVGYDIDTAWKKVKAEISEAKVVEMKPQPVTTDWKTAFRIAAILCVIAGITWWLALLYFLGVGVAGALPLQLALPLALVCFAKGVLRVTQALRMLVLRASLGGRGIEVVGTDDLARWCQDPALVFLGFGFEWQPVHSQRLYELAKIDYREFAVSPRLLQLLGYDSKPQPDAEIGLPYIHGVEPKEIVGIYRTYMSILDRDDPSRVVFTDHAPVLTANPDLTHPLNELMYIHDVVFTTGIAEHGDVYIVASGEADLACRITHIPKTRLQAR